MKRPLVWAAIFTICGVYMRLGESGLICLVSFSVFMISISRFVIFEREKKYLLLCIFPLLGFGVAGLHTGTADPTAGIVSGSGIVREVGETSGGNQKLTLLADYETETGEVFAGRKLYALWTEESRFAAGDVVDFTGGLAAFYEAAFPGAYDEKQMLQTKGFDGKLYPETMTKTGTAETLVTLPARGRTALQGQIDRLLPVEEGGLLKAMLTGEKEDIPDSVYDLYTEAGVVHVLCISGLHLSILAMYVTLLLEKGLHCSRRASAIAVMAASLLYLGLIGFLPSAVRAVVMICVVMLGRILFRLSDRLNNIAIAALVILLYEPRYLFHAGFQLSFLTVLGICLGLERMAKRGKPRGRFHALRESVAVSAYAFVFSLPVVAYHFYSVSLVGIVANLVILPLSGLVLGFGMLSVLLGFLWQPLGIFAAGSVYVILRLFHGVCALLVQLPFAYLLTGRPALLTILLYFLLLLFWFYGRLRRRKTAVTALLCAAIWCSVFANPLFRKENTVAFLDVGQGDAAVVSTYDGRAYLIDGGGLYGKELGTNVGATVILPYLRSIGVGEVEAMFLSHPDRDHLFGLLEVMAEMPVRGAYAAAYPFSDTEEWRLWKESLEKSGVPVYTVKAGDVSADGAWTCLYPFAGVAFSDGDDNHGSMVLRYAYGGNTVLFTGDIGALDERLLLESGAELRADVLKVAHHGSRYSSDADFLAAVAAETAVLSCGANNLYGHPHAETLERLADTTVLRTDQARSIFVTLAPDGTYTYDTMTEGKPFYERIKEAMEKS